MPLVVLSRVGFTDKCIQKCLYTCLRLLALCVHVPNFTDHSMWFREGESKYFRLDWKGFYRGLRGWPLGSGSLLFNTSPYIYIFQKVNRFEHSQSRESGIRDNDSALMDILHLTTKFFPQLPIGHKNIDLIKHQRKGNTNYSFNSKNTIYF